MVSEPLSDALNCVVCELEMVANGRDMVTGDPLTFEQAQAIARRALDLLVKAWNDAA